MRYLAADGVGLLVEGGARQTLELRTPLVLALGEPSPFELPELVVSADAAVVHFTVRPQPLFPADPDLLMRVVQAAFGQRRKALRNALQTLPTDAGALLAAAGVDPGLRAEALDIENFCALARAYAEVAPALPGRTV